MIIHYHEEIFNVNTISIQKDIFKKRKSICNNFSHCTFNIRIWWHKHFSLGFQILKLLQKKKSPSFRQKVQWGDSSNISLLLGEKTSWNTEETCFFFPPKKKDVFLKSPQYVACLMHICWCKWNKLNIYEYLNFFFSITF